MRPTLLLLLITAAMTVQADPPEVPEPAVRVKTDHLDAHVARRVEAEAARGIGALRRYVTATRNIHALDLSVILNVPEPPRPTNLAAPGAAPPKVAQEQAKTR